MIFLEQYRPWAIPPFQIKASIIATMMRSNRVFEASDVHDIDHAASAIPYCSAFFCDKKMKILPREKPLEFDKVYSTVILSIPEEIMAYLKQLG